jgi:3-deoxy-D-manno-octulosonic-acid transferase
MSAALVAWRFASSALFPLARAFLRKGHSAGFDERCGFYSEEKNRIFEALGGRALWIHAVSVGEAHAASPFVESAARSGWSGGIIVSTVTETGAQSAASLMGDLIASHVYAPWDVPSIVKKTADRLRPAIYITVETEVWPNLLAELRCRGIPCCLLNARISDRTLSRAKKSGGLLREAYNLFDLIMPRGDEDERRLGHIGVDSAKIRVTGDCKIDAIFGRKEKALKNIPFLRGKLRLNENSWVLTAGSTHEGEEELAVETFTRLKNEKTTRDVRLLIVPRHPDRAGKILECATRRGKACLFSDIDGLSRAEIIVVDIMGLLYELYGLSDAAFIGGSVSPRGGQNILEPASWGIPVIHGPHMEDFAEPTKALDALGVAYQVSCAEEMADVLRSLERKDAGEIARKASSWFAGRRGASDRAWAFARELLARNMKTDAL